MFIFMIPEWIILLNIVSVPIWSIAIAANLVTLVSLCMRGKTPL